MKNLLAFVVALAATLGTATAQSGGGSTSAAPHPVPADAHKPSSKPKGSNIITRSGGQGHNSGADPKGKTVVAPTTPKK